MMNSLEVFVKARRKKLGISQLELGLELGHGNAQSVSNAERFTCAFSPKTFKTLAKKLKVPVAKLIDLRVKDLEQKLKKQCQ
jgi:transcriptional regulator with XRE-family HTH domain